MDQLFEQTGRALLEKGIKVEVPTWQALDVKDKPQGATHELVDVSMQFIMPRSVAQMQGMCDPNLPWAERQFKERVAGGPLNPGETFKEWPWYRGNVEQHKEQGQFSHTYMERYWPKKAAQENLYEIVPRGEEYPDRQGIRFDYGDLNDVVNLLAKQPTTRQAYLPVFFPEDTGAVHGERIPCSLGYLFLMREGKLNITYYIRSCDFIRHFRDDVYMTMRLTSWVLDEIQSKSAAAHGDLDGWHWQDVTLGTLTMHIGSLHVFEGDLPKLRKEYATT